MLLFNVCLQDNFPCCSRIVLQEMIKVYPQDKNTDIATTMVKFWSKIDDTYFNEDEVTPLACINGTEVQDHNNNYLCMCMVVYNNYHAWSGPSVAVSQGSCEIESGLEM